MTQNKKTKLISLQKKTGSCEKKNVECFEETDWVISAVRLTLRQTDPPPPPPPPPPPFPYKIQKEFVLPCLFLIQRKTITWKFFSLL